MPAPTAAAVAEQMVASGRLCEVHHRTDVPSASDRGREPGDGSREDPDGGRDQVLGPNHGLLNAVAGDRHAVGGVCCWT